MPYVIEKVGTKYCVKSTPSGRTHGCHDTRAKAVKQQRALYRNAPPSGHSSDEGSTLPPMTALPSETAKEAAKRMTELAEGPTFIEMLADEMTKRIANPGVPTASTGLAMAVAPAEQAEAPAEAGAIWEGLLAKEGEPTDDRRYLMPGEISHRDLPLSLMVMTITDEGHKGAQLGGKITEIWREEREDGVVEIWGRGPFDSSEFGQEAARLVSEEFLTGVSIDLAVTEVLTLDPETYEPVDQEALGLEELLAADFITGVKGSIMGATLVPFAAFEDTRVTVVTASAMHVIEGATWVNDQAAERFAALVAAAGPVKPPRGWFDDPLLSELTPLTITKDGRVYGHLADWDGCHTGFQGVCVPPFRSYTNYAYFNVGEIETDTGELMPCGKIMFCMDGNGHASVEESMGVEQVQRYYDDATKVGAFVRAGADRFGTWLAGALRPGLNDIEVQHLRTHPPSGDWRPIKGGPSELVAAFSVPVPGFPISRGRALVASAGGDITAIISGPLTVDVDEAGYRRKRRLKKVMLGMRLHNAIGPKSMTREEMLVAFADGFKNYTAEQRRKMAKAGTAMPDGSFPIADCEDAANARQAIGRAPESKRSAVQAHINKRVKVLGCSKPE